MEKKKLQLRRGNKIDIPVLAVGELGFAIDTGELIIGSDEGNLIVNKLETTAIQELVKHFDNSATDLEVKAGWGIDTIKPYAFYESNLVNVDLTGIKGAGERSFYGGGEITTLKNT